MPSRGDKDHEYLKTKAMEKIIKIYGDKIDIIKNEQPQEGTEQNYFKVNISLGSYGHDMYGASVMLFPDIKAQIRLSEEEKIVIAEERKEYVESLDPKDRYGIDLNTPIPDVRVLIVECETKNSSLVTGDLTRRYHGHCLLKSQHPKVFTYILAIFNDIDVKTNLFDVIWKFPRRADS